MKLKATTLALFAAGLLAGLTLTAPATGADPPATTTTTSTVYGSASGAITALSATSITVNDLACTRSSSSPSLDGYKIGDQVGLGCANGVAIVIVDKRTPAPVTTTTPQGAGARDQISALSATSITVGPLTCSIGSTSPTVSFNVGDRVRMGCLAGVLVYIVADTDVPATTTTTTTTTPPPPVTTTTTAVVTRGGTLTAIGEHSLTVDALTCYLYPTSPSLTGFKVGDHVGVACQSNVLIKIVALSDEPQQPPHDELQTRLGSITALSPMSITVDGLTCSIGTGSPSVAGYKLGDKVGIGCSNAVLVKIGAPQTDDDSGFRVAVQLSAITSIRGDGITVGSLNCKLADTSPSVASFKLGDRVGIGCAGGILFMIGVLPTVDSAPKAEVKHVLVEHFHGCIKRGAERCIVAGVLHRLSHKK
jgi:hypothetical protein